MQRRLCLAFLLALVAFFAGKLLASKMNFALITTGWSRAYQGLRMMELHFSDELSSGWIVPSAGRINTLLESDRSPTPTVIPANDAELALVEAARNSYFDAYGAPPRFIVDSSLPRGYGFYLVGEDGLSKSRGRDSDDINSWDFATTTFYYKRMKRRHEFRDSVLGVILFGAVLVIGLSLRTPHIRSRRQRLTNCGVTKK